MGEVCVLFPNAKGTNKPSKLFNGLLDLFPRSSSDKAVDFWGKFTSDYFTEKYKEKINTDENGEFDLYDLLNKTNLIEQIEDEELERVINKELGLEKDGKKLVFSNDYNSVDELVEKIKYFAYNSNFRGIAALSLNVTEDNKLEVTFSKNKGAELMNEEFIRQQVVNKKLRQKLNDWGVGIEVIESVDRLDYSGYVDFNNISFTNGLANIIHLAKGKKGDKALPEEFSHVLIKLQYNNPIIQRYINNIRNNEEVMRAVLGEQFDEYLNKYDGNIDYVAEECAGKILAEVLVNSKDYDLSVDELGNNSSGIVGRAFEVVKDTLSSKDEYELYNILNEADAEILELAKEISKNVFVNDGFLENTPINWSKFQGAERLYQLEKSKDDFLKTLDRLIDKSDKFKLMYYKKFNRNKEEGDEYTFVEADDLNWVKKEYEEDRIDLKQALKDISEIMALINLNANKLNAYIEAINPENMSNESLARALNNAISQLQYYEQCKKDLVDLYNHYGLDKEDETKQALKEITFTINSVSDSVNDRIKALGSTMFCNFIHSVVGDEPIVIPTGPNKGKEIKIEELLTSACSDITWFEKMLSAMCNSSDFTLSGIHKAIRIAQEKGRMETNDDVNIIKSLGLKAQQYGIDIDEMMHERDEEGNLTGRYITEIDWVKFEKEEQEFIDTLPKPEKDDIEQQTRNEMKIQAWFREHTVAKEMYGSVVRVPKGEEYKNHKFEALMKDPHKKEIYDKLMEIYVKRTKQVPGHRFNRMVMIRKKFYEDIYSDKSLGEKAKDIWKRIRDSFINNESDYEIMSNGVLDFNGNVVRTLPTYYQYNDKSVLGEMSTDIISNMCNYCAMSNRYYEMSKIINQLELSRYMLNNYQKVENTSAGKIIKQINGQGNEEISTKSFKNSNLSEMLDTNFEMHVYGQYYQDLGTLDFFGKEISKTKTADNILALGSLSSIGFNLLAQAANVNSGLHQTLIEGIAGEFFDVSNLLQADKIYFTELVPQHLGYIGKRVQNDMLSLFFNHFNIKNEYEKMLGDIEWNKDNMFKRFFGPNMGFLGQEIGDMWLYTRVALALALNTKVKDSDGNEITFWDSYEKYEVAEGVYDLRLKKGLKDANGNSIITQDELIARRDKLADEQKDPKEARKIRRRKLDTFLKENEITEEEFSRDFTFKNISLAQKMFGVYSKIDKPAARQYVLGRFVLQYRDYLYPSLQRRTQKLHYNHLTKSFEEGYYRTTFRFLKNCFQEIRQGKLKLSEISKYKDSLSDMEKQNLRRAITDMAGYGAILAANMALTSLIVPFLLFGGNGDGDDDDKLKIKVPEETALTWATKFILYSCLRQKAEVGALTPIGMPFEIWKILRSPAAGISEVENLASTLKLLMFWEYFDEDGRESQQKIWENSYLNPFRQWFKHVDMDDRIRYMYYN